LDARAREATFDRMAYLKAVLETISDPVAILGADYRLIEINPAGLAMAGAKSIDEVPAEAAMLTLAPESAPAFRQHFEATLKGKTGNGQPLRVEMNGLDGVHRTMECRMARLDNSDGGTAGVVITSRDISAGEKRERQHADDESLIQAILDTVPTHLW
jgi:PAS domain S-box-containing protein